MVDIASVSIDQARFRYTQLRGPKYTAYFAAADCYSRLLSEVLPENVLPPMAAPFDVVSLQFCMHYAFESEEKVRTMLTNVTKWMKPGGRFIGTVPNDRWLLYVALLSLSPRETVLLMFLVCASAQGTP